MSQCNSLTNTCSINPSLSKIHQNAIFEIIEKGLFPYTKDNKLSGFIVYLLHVSIYGFAMFYIFLGKVNSIFYGCMALWAIAFALHFYFKGCILIKVERHLWSTKEWYGPWTLMFLPLQYFNIPITKSSSENIFICYGILIIITSICKLIFSN